LTRLSSVLDSELAEKSRTVDKYEAEIKRRNDDIAKRARDVDRLNKKLEALSGGDDDGENLGPDGGYDEEHEQGG
jgi:ubiquinone biosynthesis protein UbiJ